MDEQDPMGIFVEAYRRQGFDVVVHPDVSEKPAFLASTSVALLARKGDRIVAYPTEEHTAPDDEPVEIAADFGARSAQLLIEEAETLLNPLTLRSALVMAWAAFEAASRTALQPGKTAFNGSNTVQLLEELRVKNLLDVEEKASLMPSLTLRHMIAHGGRPERLPSEVVLSVLRVARRLLARAGVKPGLHLRDAVGATVVKNRLHPSAFKDRVESATKVTIDFLGNSREGVAVDWQLAEDARNRPVLVLKLSDATGTVAATFEPSEIDDRDRLESRLNRLWGDLLEIRSHSQLKHLLASPGEKLPVGPAA